METPILKNKPNFDNIAKNVLFEGAYFYIGYDPESDPVNVLDGVPNYYLINKATSRIEAMADTIVASESVLKLAEKIKTGEVETPELDLPGEGGPTLQ